MWRRTDEGNGVREVVDRAYALDLASEQIYVSTRTVEIPQEYGVIVGVEILVTWFGECPSAVISYVEGEGEGKGLTPLHAVGQCNIGRDHPHPTRLALEEGQKELFVCFRSRWTGELRCEDH